MISHDISRYIVIPYPISCDITRYDILGYCIHIPIFFWTDIEISHPVEIFLDTEHNFLPTIRCTRFGAPRE